MILRPQVHGLLIARVEVVINGIIYSSPILWSQVWTNQQVTQNHSWLTFPLIKYQLNQIYQMYLHFTMNENWKHFKVSLNQWRGAGEDRSLPRVGEMLPQVDGHREVSPHPLSEDWSHCFIRVEPLLVLGVLKIVVLNVVPKLLTSLRKRVSV